MPGIILVPRLSGLTVAEYFDLDGGVVSIPGTAAWTTLVSITRGAPVYLDRVAIVTYDPAAISLLTWRMIVNGVPVPPWNSQVLIGPLTETQIMHIQAGASQIDIQASNAGAVAFDCVARVAGAILAWQKVGLA